MFWGTPSSVDDFVHGGTIYIAIFDKGIDTHNFLWNVLNFLKNLKILSSINSPKRYFSLLEIL